MKRTIVVIMLLAILTVSCLVFTACQPSDPTTGPSSEHSCEFGEWTVIEQVTCTEAGLKVQVCECGESRTEIISAKGHSYTSVVTDSPCKGGYTTHTCGTCGDTYVETDGETYDEHNFQQSDTCEYCGQNIADVSEKVYDMSASSNANVKCYVVPRQDGKYDAYFKGTGAMKDSTNIGSIFKSKGYDSKLINAYIGNGITYIGEYVFFMCSITNAVISDSVTSIGAGAFSYCRSLTSVIIGDNVTIIGARAFQGCNSVTSIVLPEGVTSIDECVFYECKSLTSIDVPSSVTSIGDSAFYRCYKLASIDIPSGVTYIGSSAFSDCDSLKSITFEDPSGWHARPGRYTTENTKYLSLKDASTNATYFTSTYYNYYWYKNN